MVKKAPNNSATTEEKTTVIKAKQTKFHIENNRTATANRANNNSLHKQQQGGKEAKNFLELGFWKLLVLISDQLLD